MHICMYIPPGLMLGFMGSLHPLQKHPTALWSLLGKGSDTGLQARTSGPNTDMGHYFQTVGSKHHAMNSTVRAGSRIPMSTLCDREGPQIQVRAGFALGFVTGGLIFWRTGLQTRMSRWCCKLALLHCSEAKPGAEEGVDGRHTRKGSKN